MSVRETNVLNHSDLKYLLIDNINLYTEDAFYISGNNPYSFSVNKKTVYIYIKNIHQSGQNRSNPDECRIQVGRSANFDEALSSGKPVIILGYFEEKNVFTAWNPQFFKDRINTKATVSKYSRFSAQERAHNQGLACYIDSSGDNAITFKPEYIGLYLENYQSMHLASEENLLALIGKSEELEDEEGSSETFSLADQEYIITHKKYRRDPKFKKIINQIYGHRCAVCGIQLELTEAAHIIPHSHNKGTDEPMNGICMCPLHHTAYDKGLIYIDSEYNIKINEPKFSYLEKIRKDGGYRKFMNLHDDKITMPSSNRPSVEFLKIANKIRGIVS